MRIVTNKRRVQRKRTLAQVLFFVSLAILLGGLLLTNMITVPKGSDQSLLMFLPCLVMPIGLLTTILSVRMTNEYIRTPHPEDALADSLKGAPKNSSLYNYVLGPNHVLVTPQGIFSLTTRFHETRFKVEGEKWYNFKRRGLLAPFFIFLRQENLGDPFGQARKEADEVQALVDETLRDPNVKVQPVVVFTSPKADVEVIEPVIPVVYADLKKRPPVKSILKTDKTKPSPAVLTDQQMKKLDDAFLALVGATGAEEPDDEDDE